MDDTEHKRALRVLFYLSKAQQHLVEVLKSTDDAAVQQENWQAVYEFAEAAMTAAAVHATQSESE